jgi:hypothetical protein
MVVARIALIKTQSIQLSAENQHIVYQLSQSSILNYNPEITPAVLFTLNTSRPIVTIVSSWYRSLDLSSIVHRTRALEKKITR